MTQRNFGVAEWSTTLSFRDFDVSIPVKVDYLFKPGPEGHDGDVSIISVIIVGAQKDITDYLSMEDQRDIAAGIKALIIE